MSPETETMARKIGDSNGWKRIALPVMWPLPTPLVVTMVPLLPPSLYVNRGFTVWFHIMTFAYVLTRSPFLRRVLVLQGAGVCLGWYCAVAYDGNFDVLYRNMAGGMVPYMVREAGDQGRNYVMLAGASSCAMRALCHALDFAAHPGLALVLWALHRRSGGSLDDVLSWPVIAATWLCSRGYGMFHSYHNQGSLSPWYFGYDIYVLSGLDFWYVAYAAEGGLLLLAACCRLYWDRRRCSYPSDAKRQEGECRCQLFFSKREEVPPGLVSSESSVSAASVM